MNEISDWTNPINELTNRIHEYTNTGIQENRNTGIKNKGIKE